MFDIGGGNGLIEIISAGALRINIAGAAGAIGIKAMASTWAGWPGWAGVAACAAYLTLPETRRAFIGHTPSPLPESVREEMGLAAVRATHCGDSGIWAVQDRSGKTTFMTERELSSYGASLPEGQELVTAEVRSGKVHLRRYNRATLQSFDGRPAKGTHAPDGELIEREDYEGGRRMAPSMGMR